MDPAATSSRSRPGPWTAAAIGGDTEAGADTARGAEGAPTAEATDSPKVAPVRAARADRGGHALASTTSDARTRAATTMTDGLPVADDGMTTHSSASRATKTKWPSVAPALRLRTLSRGSRKPAIPVLRDSFHGYYRWHAKRTLRDIERVRAAYRAREPVGISMVELLRPTVGYVNYLAIAPSRRGEGIGGVLLDDALAHFVRSRAGIVFAAAEKTNRASIRLLKSRGFRGTRVHERPRTEGGPGAWGLRSRMHLVAGEVVLARHVDPTNLPRGAPLPTKEVLSPVPVGRPFSGADRSSTRNGRKGYGSGRASGGHPPR